MTDQDRIAALREALGRIVTECALHSTTAPSIARRALASDDAAPVPTVAVRTSLTTPPAHVEACRRLRRERDSARRELAALEWLTLRGYPVGQEPGGHRVSASPEPNGDPWFSSWEECARNAGMPG